MANKGSAEAVLTAGTRVRGRIVGDSDLFIFGHVEGDISVQGAVTIGETGNVAGDSLEARDLTVEGELAADVTVEGTIAIQSGAVVRGRLRGRAIRIEEGASVSADLDADFELPDLLR